MSCWPELGLPRHDGDGARHADQLLASAGGIGRAPLGVHHSHVADSTELTAKSSASVGPRRLGALRAHLSDPLYRTGYLLMAGTGITGGVGFVFWVLAAHEYSAKIVGFSSASISAMVLVSGVCVLGLDAVLVRYLPIAGPSARSIVIRTYAVTTLLSLGLGAGAALTSALWSPSIDFLGAHVLWIVGFALATAVWTVFTLQDSVMTGLRSAQWVPVENAIYSIAKLVLLLIFARALPRAGPFVAWNAPTGLAVLAVSGLIFRRLIPQQASARPASYVDRRQLIVAAAGNYGGVLCSMASTLLLPILVAAETNLTQTAYFYIPWTISTMLRLLAVNMTTSLTVEAALDERRVGQLTRRALLHTMRLVVPLAVVCGVAAPWILGVFGPGYAKAGATLLRLLSVAAIPTVVVFLGIGVARVLNSAKAVLAIQAAEGLLMLGLSLALLPSAGINGVGVAWLVSQTVVAVVLLTGMLRPLLVPLRGSVRG